MQRMERGRLLSAGFIVMCAALDTACGPVCTEDVVEDTWDVTCFCAALNTGLPEPPTAVSVQQICEIDHDGDGALADGAAIGACHGAANALIFGTGPDYEWECVPDHSTRVAVASCVDTVRVDCDAVGMTRDPLIAWRNYRSTFIGTLDPDLSHVAVTYGGDTATPTPLGEVFVTGGDCDGASCPMTVDGLIVRLSDFTLDGYSASDVELTTLIPWGGVKRADDTYEFDPAAPLKLAGDVDGEPEVRTGAPRDDVRGAFHSVPAPLPHDPSAVFRYMTIEGTFAVEGVLLDLFLVFPFGAGAPRPSIDARWVTCTTFAPPPNCGWVFDAGDSEDFDGNPVAGYRWYDANGDLVGTGPTIYMNNIYEVPGEASRFPLVVTVVDESGSEASRATGPWPEPERTGASGFVWASQPSTASYTASATYSWSSSGGAITIARNGIGDYAVTFAGLGGAGGNVQASAYGADRACRVGWWGTSGTALVTSVRCSDGAGAPADAMFVAQYHREALVEPAPRDRTPELAYLWAHSPTTASYAPSASYAFNDGGAASTIRRVATGVYAVTIPGHHSTGASVQVTPYGSGNQRCQVRAWSASSSAALVDVGCFSPAGAPADSMFTLSFTQQTVSSPSGTGVGARRRGAYARVVFDDDDGVPRAPVNFQHNALGGAAGGITVTSSATGTYAVAIPRSAAVTQDSVQVTATGVDAARCRVTGWARYSNRTVAGVACASPTGAALHSAFELRYLTSSSP